MSPARALFLALCQVSPALARRPHRTPCADGRFPLRAARPLSAGVPLILVLREGTAAVEPVCAPVPATLRATRRGTIVRAVWSSCPGAGGRVRGGPLRVNTRTVASDGTVSGVRLPFGDRAMPSSVRAYLMVDAYPAARGLLAIPASS